MRLCRPSDDAYGRRTVLASNGSTVLTASAIENQIGFTGRYHDALGRRVVKTVGSTTTRFIREGARTSVEYDNGTAARSYVYGDYMAGVELSCSIGCAFSCDYGCE